MPHSPKSESRTQRLQTFYSYYQGSDEKEQRRVDNLILAVHIILQDLWEQKFPGTTTSITDDDIREIIVASGSYLERENA
jgi:hypothetical protein